MRGARSRTEAMGRRWADEGFLCLGMSLVQDEFYEGDHHHGRLLTRRNEGHTGQRVSYVKTQGPMLKMKKQISCRLCMVAWTPNTPKYVYCWCMKERNMKNVSAERSALSLFKLHEMQDHYAPSTEGNPSKNATRPSLLHFLELPTISRSTTTLRILWY